MCLFCNIVTNTIYNEESPENQILDETENFYLKSALGQFVEGYVLINSKIHLPNFSFIQSSQQYDELETFVRSTKKRIADITGKNEFIVFEHGSTNKLCFNKNCEAKCIDHAHLHIIPTHVDILEELKRKFSVFEINSFCKVSHKKNQSYIYYSTQNGKHFVIEVTSLIPSQFIRQVICKKLETPILWNWSQHPFRDRIKIFNQQYLEFTEIRQPTKGLPQGWLTE